MVKIITLRDAFKEKIKMELMFREKEGYASIIKVQIIAKKKWINLIIEYGLSDTSMILKCNIQIKNKEDEKQE